MTEIIEEENGCMKDVKKSMFSSKGYEEDMNDLKKEVLRGSR